MGDKKPSRVVPEFPAANATPPESRILSEVPGSHRLIITPDLADRTLLALRERSADWRESAAIWAGTVLEDRWEAQRVYFHHELGDDRAGPLSLELSENAKYRLYETLHRDGLRLIALIHTHPAEWVDLSEIDQQNQVCSRIGFWSLVIPWYGRRAWRLHEIGVHERTEYGWHRLGISEVGHRVGVGG